MAELYFMGPQGPFLKIRLEKSRTRIGRAHANDVILPDLRVSRYHAEILRRGADEYLLHWVQTKNEEILADGQPVRIGPYEVFLRQQPSRATEQTQGMAPNPQDPDGAAPPVHLMIKESGKKWGTPLGPGLNVVGKDPASRIVIGDPFASASHCAIFFNRNHYHIRDLDSTNGTLVNGLKIKEAELPYGAKVQIGHTELELIALAAAPDPDPTGPQPGKFGMVGQTPGMQKLYDRIARVSPQHEPVLILGETGTGKELVARAIHDQSTRREREFIPINCASLNRELMDSEIFGHEKGAFTGADRAHLGAFEQAAEGTLFLDEIGELPLESQAKLLRAIDYHEIRRVGSSRPCTINTRVVAATHQPIPELVKTGKFREDLYHRLNVFVLQIPPLRDRRDDILLLADALLQRHALGPQAVLSPPARQALLAHPWPGNVRELRNAIFRGLVLKKGPEIEAEDLLLSGEGGD